jgi:HSP20 family molecular chaperone IbpA
VKEVNKKMDSFFNFDDLFVDFDNFGKRFMERIQKEIDETEKAIKSGELKGNWDVKKIDEPEVKGYIIQGRFWTDEPFETFDLFEPLRPRTRRPIPERPLKISEKDSIEIREPLTDLFEEDKVIRIYAELPGEEKSDIKLDFKKDKVEIKGKKFQKTVNLPTENIDKEKTTSKYTNGVLEVTIPKKEKYEPKYHRL